MEIVNHRLIIEENEITVAIITLENIIRGILYSLGHKDSAVEVIFDDECYNEVSHRIWNELIVDITHPNNNNTYITFTTENYYPTLVKEDGKFNFYYVFELCSYTATDLINLTNGHYPGMVSLENKIIQQLWKITNSSSVTIKISK